MEVADADLAECLLYVLDARRLRGLPCAAAADVAGDVQRELARPVAAADVVRGLRALCARGDDASGAAAAGRDAAFAAGEAVSPPPALSRSASVSSPARWAPAPADKLWSPSMWLARRAVLVPHATAGTATATAGVSAAVICGDVVQSSAAERLALPAAVAGVGAAVAAGEVRAAGVPVPSTVYDDDVSCGDSFARSAAGATPAAIPEAVGAGGGRSATLDDPPPRDVPLLATRDEPANSVGGTDVGGNTLLIHSQLGDVQASELPDGVGFVGHVGSSLGQPSAVTMVSGSVAGGFDAFGAASGGSAANDATFSDVFGFESRVPGAVVAAPRAREAEAVASATASAPVDVDAASFEARHIDFAADTRSVSPASVAECEKHPTLVRGSEESAERSIMDTVAGRLVVPAAHDRALSHDDFQSATVPHESGSVALCAADLNTYSSSGDVFRTVHAAAPDSCSYDDLFGFTAFASAPLTPEIPHTIGIFGRPANAGDDGSVSVVSPHVLRDDAPAERAVAEVVNESGSGGGFGVFSAFSDCADDESRRFHVFASIPACAAAPAAELSSAACPRTDGVAMHDSSAEMDALNGGEEQQVLCTPENLETPGNLGAVATDKRISPEVLVSTVSTMASSVASAALSQQVVAHASRMRQRALVAVQRVALRAASDALNGALAAVRSCTPTARADSDACSAEIVGESNEICLESRRGAPGEGCCSVIDSGVSEDAGESLALPAMLAVRGTVLRVARDVVVRVLDDAVVATERALIVHRVTARDELVVSIARSVAVGIVRDAVFNSVASIVNSGVEFTLRDDTPTLGAATAGALEPRSAGIGAGNVERFGDLAPAESSALGAESPSGDAVPRAASLSHGVEMGNRAEFAGSVASTDSNSADGNDFSVVAGNFDAGGARVSCDPLALPATLVVRDAVVRAARAVVARLLYVAVEASALIVARATARKELVASIARSVAVEVVRDAVLNGVAAIAHSSEEVVLRDDAPTLGAPIAGAVGAMPAIAFGDVDVFDVAPGGESPSGDAVPCAPSLCDGVETVSGACAVAERVPDTVSWNFESSCVVAPSVETGASARMHAVTCMAHDMMHVVMAGGMAAAALCTAHESSRGVLVEPQQAVAVCYPAGTTACRLADAGPDIFADSVPSFATFAASFVHRILAVAIGTTAASSIRCDAAGMHDSVECAVSAHGGGTTTPDDQRQSDGYPGSCPSEPAAAVVCGATESAAGSFVVATKSGVGRGEQRVAASTAEDESSWSSNKWHQVGRC